jgi:hypothetical protein
MGAPPVEAAVAWLAIELISDPREEATLESSEAPLERAEETTEAPLERAEEAAPLTDALWFVSVVQT